MNLFKTLRRATPIATLAMLVGAMAVGLTPAVQAATHNDAAPADEVSSTFLNNATSINAAVGPKSIPNGQGHARHGITGIDSIQNFNDHFFTAGFDGNGNPNSEWYTNTVGNPPQQGGTTTINAPIVPVTVELLDSSGNQRFVGGNPLISSPANRVTPVLNSPVFSNSSYSSSSTPTQFTDAVQRAEFQNAKPDWHTLLSPSVQAGEVMKVPLGLYHFALNGDGTCCRFILIDYNEFGNLLFPTTVPVDNSTVVGQAELSGAITTKDISTFLFPDTYLYFGTTANCCVLGYHSYDFEPGDASNGNLQRDYVLNYSSWISPGLFGGGFGDVTALSHELAETFNDPFVASDGIHNVTPWWLSPNGNCQDNLEVGDPIEGIPNDVDPITLNGFTYHPQNIALRQWFMSGPSNAIDGAYSYPNETTLTSPGVSQNPGCS